MKNMPLAAMVIGGLLIALGIGLYIAAIQGGHGSWTALIPAIIGGVIGLCGVVSLKEGNARKHAMHAAAAVALLGTVGSLRGVIDLARYSAGQITENARPLAYVGQTVTVVLLTVFVALAVTSFIQARKARPTGVP